MPVALEVGAHLSGLDHAPGYEASHSGSGYGALSSYSIGMASGRTLELPQLSRVGGGTTPMSI